MTAIETQTRPLARSSRLAITMVMVIAAIVSIISEPNPANAQSQSPGEPIVLTQGATQDVITYLMAGGAEQPDSFTWPRRTDGTPKYLWLGGWATTDQYLKWTVRAASTAEFQLTSMLSAAPGDQFRVFLDNQPVLDFTVQQSSWRREVVGNLTIPEGQHALMVKRLNVGSVVKIKAFELIQTADLPAYEARAADFNKTGAAWRDQDWGVMFQMGQWSYPPAGDKLPIDQAAAAFDVAKFVETVKSMHADYVIWSVTWWSYEIWAPIRSVDRIVGHGNRTSRRDLIGEIAAALKAEGINFYLYYHTGQDTHTGYNKTDWWKAQQFPDTFAKYGTGDRSTFFNNWESVITEMGQRWGTNLDGWFFDDGLIYYPAPYERLGAAARAGNPNRTVSWNNWYTSVYTDFTDVSFGEICRYGSAPKGGDGRYPGGAEEGVMGHCMFHVNNDWGIHGKNQGIRPPSRSVAVYTAEVRNRTARNLPFSANIMMYSDGTVDPATLAWMQGVSRSVVADKRCGWGCERLDARASSLLLGNWSLVGGANKGDDNDDVMTTPSDLAHMRQDFSGTGVRIVGPKGPGGAVFRVAIDGKMLARVETRATTTTAQEVLWEIDGLPKGQHNVTIYKGSRGSLTIDYFEATSNAFTLNNTADRLSYDGSWGQAAGSAGDFLGDVTVTAVDGDSMNFSFDGTGVRVLAPRAPDLGDVEVSVDGQSYGLWSAKAAEPVPTATLFEVSGLAPGHHTVTLTKRSGAFLPIDAVDIEYRATTIINNSDPSIRLRGPWMTVPDSSSYRGDRSIAFFDGDWADVSFTGTGIRIYGDESTNGATVAVTVDGVDRGQWSQVSPAQRRSQVPFVEIDDLSPGAHTVTLTKVSGGVFTLDSVETWAYDFVSDTVPTPSG